ncbi:hypothetical protein [Mycoplasma seminis]|uniref:Ribbon-helix-helix protein CopG domain-containing protein n=1 Tax=Mycoplasma seminis TaxID=512749 RepID=A0ABY9H980_9MOLU|nr:hypothetical protein [Mycoplasma seminis]WLP85147.1 hypothetical protein Q8852_02365 [Mycoplasma seminis]
MDTQAVTTSNRVYKKPISITLTPLALAKLDQIIEEKGGVLNRSQAIELLIRGY